MSIRRNIKQYLFHHGVSYIHKIHPVAYTAQEIAQVGHIPGGEFAKTVVLNADGRQVMAVLPADHMINFDALKKQIGCATLALATEGEFKARFDPCEPGAMPPLGKLFGMPVYCDTVLAKQSEIEFNAGSHVDAVRMKYAEFAKLENPLMLRFSEKWTDRKAARAA